MAVDVGFNTEWGLEMNDLVSRTNYQRRRYYDRRKKKPAFQSNNFKQKLIIQIAICTFIIIVVSIVSKVNTKFTNYLYEKISWAVTWEMNIGGVGDKINGIFNKINGKDSEKGGLQTENAGDSGHSSAVDINAAANILNKMILPVEGIVETPFGERLNNISGIPEFHRGIDIRTNGGFSIRAALEGEVIETGSDKSYGNYIKIRHEKDIITVYAYCSEILVSKGQKVTQGDVIGKTENKNENTHLHFEIWIGTANVNPENYLRIN